MTRTSRLLRRLVVVGASTAVIGAGVIPLAEGVANAAAGDTATAVTLSPHGASDTVGDCTPYTATVAPSGGIFDLQLSTSAPADEEVDYGFCDISNYSTTTYPNQVLPTPVLTSGNGTGGSGVFAGNDSNGNAVNACFDDNTGGTSANATTCDAQIDPGANTKVSFGLFLDRYKQSTDQTAQATGTMGIVAYDDTHVNNVFEPATDTQLDSTSETWSANTASSVSCSPSSQTAQQSGNASLACTATTAAGTTYTDYFGGNREVTFVVTSGPDKNETLDCSFAPDYTKVTSTSGLAGGWTCTVSNTSNTAGTDAVTIYADNNVNNVLDSGEPSTTATVNFAAPAPAASTVTLTCSPNSTDTAPDTCVLPLTTKSATIKATVKTSAGAAVAGALVDFSMGNTGGNRVSINPDGDETLDGGASSSCTTGADGTCTTTLTDASPDDPEGVRETGSVPLAVGGPATDTSDVIWQQPRAFEARFISVTPDTSSQPPTGGQVFVAKVTNRSGDPVAGICVGFKVAGSGSFASPNSTACGSYPEGTPTNQSADFSFATTCFTGGNGVCAVQLNSVSNSTGTSTVTGTILTSNDGPGARSGNFFNYDDNTGENRAAFECSLPAGVTYGTETINRTNYRDLPASTDSNAPTSTRWTQTGLAAGVCSDNGAVTWRTSTTSHRVVVGLHLTCFSPRRHVVKCVAQLSRPISGVTVVFRNAHGTIVGRDVTNSSGKAVMKLRHLRSHRTHRYHAHARRSARTFAADSNTAKVTVS